MPFFPVDDDFTFHRKARAAGNAAIGLWTRAGAYCMKQATDGVVLRAELDGMGKLSEARKLVEVALWHAPGHDCDRCPQPPKGGWLFHDWHDIGRYKSGEQLKAERVAAKERMRAKRAREREGDVRANGDRTWDDRSGSPRPHPLPVLKSVSQGTAEVLARLTDGDIEKIRTRLGAPTASHAERVALEVLTRTDGEVRQPLRYILKAIDTEPDRYKPTPGPVRKTDECSTHPGQAAAHCGGCRADQIAGDR